MRRGIVVLVTMLTRVCMGRYRSRRKERDTKGLLGNCWSGELVYFIGGEGTKLFFVKFLVFVGKIFLVEIQMSRWGCFRHLAEP